MRTMLRRMREDVRDWIDPVRRGESSLHRYPGYTWEDLAVFKEFAPQPVAPRPGFFSDFLGVRTRTNYADGFGRLDGKAIGPPFPYSDSVHAETVEYIGLLRAVLEARDRFTAMELGAGWGPWIVAGAVAARRRGIEDLRLFAVEGDPVHYGFLLDHFRDNGLDPDAQSLIRAVVGVEAGTARWPVKGDGRPDWGHRPLDEADYRGEEMPSFVEVPRVSFADLVAKEAMWDLLHIDVQGGEFALVESAVDLLDARVRRLIIGTHSRKIEGDLIDFLYRRGWILENEKPAKFAFKAETPTLEGMTYLDGTQTWKNPRV